MPHNIAKLASRARDDDAADELALTREALEHTPFGVCMFDRRGRIVLCNRRYAEILQLPAGSIGPGTTARELIELGKAAGHYPADRPISRIQDDIRESFRAAGSGPATMVRGDRTYAVRRSTTPNGYILTTCEDITAQVEAERASRRSECRLQAIFDAMPDCVKIFDEGGTLVYINPKGLDLLQAPDFGALSTPGYLAVPPEYLEPCLDVHRRVIAGEPVVWTYEVVGLLGRRRHVEAHAVPFRLPGGGAAHLCISRDVNARVEAEIAFRASEERLRLVQEATGLADFESGADGVSVCSDRFFEQLGLPVGDGTITAARLMELIHPDDRTRVQHELEQTFARLDGRFQSEYRIVRADTGETRWLACSGRLEYDADGGLARTIGAHLDITERKRAEQAVRQSEERLRLVQEATGLADFEAGPDGVAHVSEQFNLQAGLPPGTRALVHSDWLKVVHPDDRQRLQRDIARSLRSAEVFQCEFRIVRPDNGEVRWIFSRTKMERDKAGKAIRTIGAHLDITERKAAEHALRESEERFRLAAEAAGLGVWDYDPSLDRRTWSDRLREIFGLPADLEPSRAAAEACIHPADRSRFTRMLQRALDTDIGRFEASFRIRRASDGAERWIAVNGWRTYKADSRLRRIIMTVRDVTDEKTAEERVRWSASHDALTRLANRSLFQEKLDQAIQTSRASGTTVGLLVMDMDHFKQINDTLGHDAGDCLLALFAERLRGVVRAGDTVARLGGDEFAVILPDIDGEPDVQRLSRSVQARLREPFVHEGRLLDCRVSMGASVFPVHGETPEELLKNADIALYVAKGGGRAALAMFEPHMRDDVRRRAEMVQLARDAIREDRIVPYYQPKLDLASRTVIGLEALLRWRTPNGRIATPAGLEAAFEDLEVAAELSDRMVERVIADMRGWLDRGIQFDHVAINAAAAELRRDNFAERLLEQLWLAGIPTRCLQLEVTETVFLGRGAEYVHRALALLNARGVRIALDDFGTGYASLRHLKQFPVDIIKVDQSFVRDMNQDPGDEAIVRAVINLGRSLGIKVVAEGIETEEQAARLIELDCDFGQGFLFSKAVAASRVPALVARFEPAAARAARRPLRLVAGSR